MSGADLELTGVDVGRKGGPRLCRDLDLTIRPGERWGVLGVNGSGKTTLLHTLAGLLPALGGSVRLDGVDIDRLPRRRVALRLGLLPQDSQDPFPATVLETALMGRHPHLGPWRSEGPDDLRIAREALAAVGLSAMAARRADTLSGGERRRLAVATLLAQDPCVYLLDEPLNHLDIRHQMEVLALLTRAGAESRSVVMTLHEPTLASRYCDRVLLLFGDETWDAGDPAELLSAECLGRLYRHPIEVVESRHGRVFLPA